MAASLTTYQLTPLYAGPVVGAEPVSVAVAGTVGPTGPAGEQGVQGPAGGGLPVGGATGTVLQKQSPTDGDADWFDLFGSNNTWTGSQDFRIVSVQSPASTQLPVVIVGFPGQTADLIRWTDSSAATLASVSAAGVITAAGFDGPGSALTALAAGNIASGTLADARLSANVPLLDAENTWAEAQTFEATVFASGGLDVSGGDTTIAGNLVVTGGAISGDGSALTALAPANVSAGVFVASQVFTSPLLVRQSGGVAGTDEIEVVHDGNTATLRNKETGGIRYRNAADNLTTFQVTNVGRAVAVEFQGDGTFLTGVDLLHELGAVEVAVTGATTATLGRMHVCSGTTADYTVTLPTASGNAGKFIGLRMSDALTKLVTIDADGAELIDGQATRVMWAGESAILLCDGSNWFKVAGKTIPMTAEVYRGTAQSISNSTVTLIQMDATQYDSGGLADLANDRINVRRVGRYLGNASILYPTVVPGGGGAMVQARIHAGSPGSTTERKTALFPGVGGTFSSYLPFVTTVLELLAGDCVELHAYQESGGSVNTSTLNAAVMPRLTLVEQPSW